MVEIDPELADTAAMTEAYDVPLAASANCVVVAGRRDGDERVAACVVRADTRADVNNLVKRTLDVRKASFLSMERAVEESGMEYGGITPVGLPARLAAAGRRPRASTSTSRSSGSGVRRSKLLLPGAAARRAPRRRGRPTGLGTELRTRPPSVQTVAMGDDAGRRPGARTRPRRSASTASGTTCSRSCGSCRRARS